MKSDLQSHICDVLQSVFALHIVGGCKFVGVVNCTARPMFAVKTKIYGVLYKQSSSIAFDETSSY